MALLITLGITPPAEEEQDEEQALRSTWDHPTKP